MRFVLSGNLLRFAEFQREVAVEAGTINEGIAALATRFPALRRVLLDGQDDVRRIYRVFLNGEPLGHEDLGRAASATDEISLITAIAGG
jgi:hypothetical protein